MSRPEETSWRRAGPPTDNRGGGYDQRGGYDRRDNRGDGGWRRDGNRDNRGGDRDGNRGGEDGWRRGGSGGSSRFDDRAGQNGASGGRPRLNLSKRTVDKGETDATAAVEKMDVKDEGEGANAEGGEEGAPAGEERNRREREPRKFREPEVVNSRAAMLGEAAAPRKEELGDRRRDTRDRRTTDRNEGPPPVVNERFAKLAAEEKEKNIDREFARRDGRDAPQNSRFAAAADADRPPVQQNSRFAAAADAYSKEREVRDMERGERAPPPVQQNSRFAAAAADYDRERGERDAMRAERGERFDRREDGGRDGGRFGRDAGPAVPPQNSRFAAAMAEDADYVPADVRQQRERERMEQREMGGGDERRGGGFGGEERRGGGFGDRGGGRYGDRGGRYGNRQTDGEIVLPTAPKWKQEAEAADDNAFPPINKGNVSNILAPKKREEETVLPPVAMPLTLPGEDEEAAKARLEKARLEKEAKAAKEKEEEEARKAEEARLAEEAKNRAAKAAEAETFLLDEFISGKKLGADLQQWCADQGAVLPSVEKLIYHLLYEKEQKNPNPECPWAESSKYGAALLSLVEDKGYEQMQVLWAIQKYCDTIGFPKLNDEYIVQTMFRSMYKYDLVEAGAFDAWKEDESEENAKGKTKAVIQTMDWFAWLEEDDDDDEEEYEEEEE